MNKIEKYFQDVATARATVQPTSNPVELPSELAEKLLRPGGAALKQAHDKRLADLEARLRKRMTDGLVRSEYADMTAMVEAVVQGRVILAKLPANRATGVSPAVPAALAASTSASATASPSTAPTLPASALPAAGTTDAASVNPLINSPTPTTTLAARFPAST